MFTQEFHRYLKNPELLNADTLPLLKELVQTKPAFQQAWMLLLKNLKLLGSPEFETYLEKAIQINPDFAESYRLMSKLKKSDPQDLGLCF